MPESRRLAVKIVWWALAGMALALGGCGGRANTPTPQPTPIPTLAADTAPQARAFEALCAAVAENYVRANLDGVDWPGRCQRFGGDARLARSETEFAAVVSRLVEPLPPDTVIWQSRSERIQRDLENTAIYHGIGAYISVRATPVPRVVILSVVPQSPAEQAGLQPHDVILAIDGDPVRAEEGTEVVRRIRGPANSQATLTVRSPGGAERAVVVTRAELVAFDRLRLGLIPNTRLLYLLFPPSPYDELAAEVAGSIQALAEEGGLDGIILDLRIATTGSGWPLVELLTVFGDGDMGEFYTRADTSPLTVTGQDFGGSQTLPLAVLVGPDTRGLAELFAAALQARGRATVVGLPTPGAVGGMSEFPLPDGSRVFVLTSAYRTPDGRELRAAGIRPDVAVANDWDTVTMTADPVRDAAVRALGGSQSAGVTGGGP